LKNSIFFKFNIFSTTGASKAIDVWMSNHAEASAAAVATATLQFMQDQSSAVQVFNSSFVCHDFAFVYLSMSIQGALFSWWTLSQWRDAARALNSACSLDRVESLSTSSIENHDSDEDHVEFTQSSRVESNIIQTAFVQSLSSTMTHIADMDQRIQSMSSVLTKLDAQHGESDWSEVLASFAQRCGLADFLPTELSVSSLARSTNEMTPLEQWAKLLQHIGRSTADLHAAAATMTAHSQHRQQVRFSPSKYVSI
jgi:hypothetical protein